MAIQPHGLGCLADDKYVIGSWPEWLADTASMAYCVGKTFWRLQLLNTSQILIAPSRQEAAGSYLPVIGDEYADKLMANWSEAAQAMRGCMRSVMACWDAVVVAFCKFSARLLLAVTSCCKLDAWTEMSARDG